MLTLPKARTPALSQALSAVHLAQNGPVRRYPWHLLCEMTGVPTRKCRRFLQECRNNGYLRKTSTGNFKLTVKGKEAMK